VKSTRDQTPPKNNRRNNTDNAPNPDAQYLKSMRLMSPTLVDVMTHNFS